MDLYYFTSSASNNDSGVFEYEGSKIGVSNVITSVREDFTKSSSNRINVDETVLEKMFAHIKSIEEKEKVFLCDVIIHGVRVRLTTTSRHISEFFTDNFYNPREYSEQAQESGVERQGSIVPFKVNVYVINGIFDNVPLYCYNTSTNSIYIFNCSFYKVLYEIVIEAAAKILREDRGFIIEKTTVVESNKNSVAVLGCNHSGYSCGDTFCSYCYKPIQGPAFKMQSMDYAVYRFAFKCVSTNKYLSPIKAVMANGEIKKGSELMEFLCECISDENVYISNLNVMLSCLSTTDEKCEVLLSNLDINGGAEIFSYPLFKNFYQKSSTINHYPAATYQFLHSKLENIPEITQEFMIANSQTLEAFVRNELRGSKDASIAKYFNSISEEDGKKYVARFSCFGESYVLIDMAKIFGKVKIISNPFYSARLKCLGVFKKMHAENFQSSVFLKNMPEENLKETANSSMLVKLAKNLCKTNIRICELNIYDDLAVPQEAGVSINSIYEELVKKMFSIEDDKNKNGIIIDGSNFKTLFPPPPPPKS
ncbi:MAG TPA: hypothetical protein PKW98_05905 [Candidatus Wallbacteria bacterium]|nr:MAG: hypothetical protein BWY32_00619 [bacterium ADurb.Bin243]HPG57331.1 hypothetical protein [Candidatus Wallbacteria bacterium]